MDDKDPIQSNGIIDEFEADDGTYVVNIRHYSILRQDERKAYNLQDGQFLVHLFDMGGFKTFKVFLDEQLFWVTDASELFVQKEFIDVIGSIIDERTH